MINNASVFMVPMLFVCFVYIYKEELQLVQECAKQYKGKDNVFTSILFEE